MAGHQNQSMDNLLETSSHLVTTEMASGDTTPVIALFASLEDLVSDIRESWSLYPPQPSEWQDMEEGVRREHVLERLEEALSVTEEEADVAHLTYPSVGDWSNVHYHPGYGLLPAETPKISFIAGDSLRKLLRILEVMRDLVINNKRTTKRDIYYQMFVEFTSQTEVDRLVSVAVSMLQVPRLMLGVMATSKGLVVGDLIYTNTEGVIVDCNLAVGGDTIPQDVTSITNIVTQARLVLVVEKDAVFQRLLEEGILTSPALPPLIMVTGKGVPDLATRQLLRLLHLRATLPVLLLTDCDPYGLDIMLMYKFGSLAMTWAAEPLAVPSSVWLGLLPSDLSSLEIPVSSTKPHTEADTKKLWEVSKREYLAEEADNEELRQELELMWSLGRKAEIQQVIESREEGFLTQQFLPWKIQKRAWIS